VTVSAGECATRCALVTGGSRGIGRGIALALAGAGHDVAVAARTESGLQETVAAAAEAGASRAVALAVDLSDAASCRALASEATIALGRAPDIFVHCAGVALNGKIGTLSLQDWNMSFAVNVTSAFILAGELAAAMKEHGWGRIITIGSLYSRIGVARTAAYTSTKHAIVGLTRVLAAELISEGVTANAILPGFVDTEMVRQEALQVAEARSIAVEAVIEKFLRVQPIGRMVTTSEVGALVAYLCSDAAAPITGQSINIDGGAYQA
jgi:NAD(P)-dependent dehydrogenase (short-subunit alcohol dehydrogenase family)